MYLKLASIFTLYFLTARSSPVSQEDTSANRVYPACLFGSERIQVNQQAKRGNFVFECQQYGNTVKVAVVACLDDNGKQREIGDRWDVESNGPFKFVMECSKVDGVPTRKVVQCFYDSDEGQARLDPGQEQKVGKTLVKCEKMGELGVRYGGNGDTSSSNTGNSTSAEQDCVMEGQRFPVNQRARVNGFVYGCEPDGGSVRPVIVACLDKEKQEHAVDGDRWEEESEGGTGSQLSLRYVFECVKQDGITSRRVAQCVYNGTKIDVGSQQVVGKIVVHCNKMGTNGGMVSFGPGSSKK